MNFYEVYSWCGLATLAAICAMEFWCEQRLRGLGATPLDNGQIALLCLLWPLTWLVVLVCVLASIGDELS